MLRPIPTKTTATSENPNAFNSLCRTARSPSTRSYGKKPRFTSDEDDGAAVTPPDARLGERTLLPMLEVKDRALRLVYPDYGHPAHRLAIEMAVDDPDIATMLGMKRLLFVHRLTPHDRNARR